MPDVVCDFEAPRDASAANTSPALAAVPVIEATEPARIGALADKLGRLLLSAERNYLWLNLVGYHFGGDLYPPLNSASWKLEHD